MDFSKIFEQMNDAQEKIKAAQKDVGKIEITQEVGGGLVKVCMNGNKKVLQLTIDDALLNTNSKKMVEDLVIAAMNLATSAVEKQIEDALKKNTLGMMKDVPLDFLR